MRKAKEKSKALKGQSVLQVGGRGRLHIKGVDGGSLPALAGNGSLRDSSPLPSQTQSTAGKTRGADKRCVQLPGTPEQSAAATQSPHLLPAPAANSTSKAPEFKIHQRALDAWEIMIYFLSHSHTRRHTCYLQSFVLSFLHI